MKFERIVSLCLLILSMLCIARYMYTHPQYCNESKNYDYPFQDPTLPVEMRLDNLMSLLTQEEKVMTRLIFLMILRAFED